MYHPRKIPTYIPKRDAVKAIDLNEIVKRLERLENLYVFDPLYKIDEPNSLAIGCRSLEDSIDINYYNDSGEICPRYGCLMVSDKYGEEPQETILKIQKPSSTFKGVYLFNRGSDIEYELFGRAQTNLNLVKFRYDSGSTPTFGYGFGPKPNSWDLFENYPALVICIAPVDTTNHYAIGFINPIYRLLGKITTDHPKNTEQYVKIYSGVPSAEIDTGFTVSAWNTLQYDLEYVLFAELRVELAFFNNDWYIIGVQPPAMQIRCTLTGTLNYSSASVTATVDNYCQGIDPGTPITLWNQLISGSLYMFAGSIGTKVFAYYDDILQKYIIYQLNC